MCVRMVSLFKEVFREAVVFVCVCILRRRIIGGVSTLGGGRGIPNHVEINKIEYDFTSKQNLLAFSTAIYKANADG